MSSESQLMRAHCLSPAETKEINAGEPVQLIITHRKVNQKTEPETSQTTSYCSTEEISLSLGTAMIQHKTVTSPYLITPDLHKSSSVIGLETAFPKQVWQKRLRRTAVTLKQGLNAR